MTQHEQKVGWVGIGLDSIRVGWCIEFFISLDLELLKPKRSCKILCFLLSNVMFKNSFTDVFDKIFAKQRANNAHLTLLLLLINGRFSAVAMYWTNQKKSILEWMLLLVDEWWWVSQRIMVSERLGVLLPISHFDLRQKGGGMLWLPRSTSLYSGGFTFGKPSCTFGKPSCAKISGFF